MGNVCAALVSLPSGSGLPGCFLWTLDIEGAVGSLWIMKPLHIDDVRDLMCLENSSLTPDEAINILTDRFPHETEERIRERVKLIAEVREIAAKK